MENNYRVKYTYTDGRISLSKGKPFSDHRSAEFNAAIGRVTGPGLGIVNCEVVFADGSPVAPLSDNDIRAMGSAAAYAGEPIEAHSFPSDSPEAERFAEGFEDAYETMQAGKFSGSPD